MSNEKKKQVPTADNSEENKEMPEEMPIEELVERVCHGIASKYICVDRPVNGNAKLCEKELRDMALAIEKVVWNCVDWDRDILISEACGILLGLACRYKNGELPGIYEQQRQGIYLARLVLDCIDDEIFDTVIHHPTMVEGAELLDDFI